MRDANSGRNSAIALSMTCASALLRSTHAGADVAVGDVAAGSATVAAAKASEKKRAVPIRYVCMRVSSQTATIPTLRDIWILQKSWVMRPIRAFAGAICAAQRAVRARKQSIGPRDQSLQ